MTLTDILWGLTAVWAVAALPIVLRRSEIPWAIKLSELRPKHPDDHPTN